MCFVLEKIFVFWWMIFYFGFFIFGKIVVFICFCIFLFVIILVCEVVDDWCDDIENGESDIDVVVGNEFGVIVR